jgi:hypothetical protein
LGFVPQPNLRRDDRTVACVSISVTHGFVDEHLMGDRCVTLHERTLQDNDRTKPMTQNDRFSAVIITPKTIALKNDRPSSIAQHTIAPKP